MSVEADRKATGTESTLDEAVESHRRGDSEFVARAEFRAAESLLDRPGLFLKLETGCGIGSIYGDK